MTAVPPLAESAEKGSLGILHLKRLWSRTLASRLGQSRGAVPPEDWLQDNTLVCGLGLGLRETLQYLFDQVPSLEQFEGWILAQHGGTIAPERVERLNWALAEPRKSGPTPLRQDLVFTPAEMDSWEENGYTVLHDAVAPADCRAAIQAICQFLKMDLDRPDTWYGGPQGHSIWIPLLHHPALEANRQSLRIQRAFAQLWGRTDLWVTTDQCGMNPPEREGWNFPGPDLHWDVSLALPSPSAPRASSTWPTSPPTRAPSPACPDSTAAWRTGWPGCPPAATRVRSISRPSPSPSQGRREI